MFVPAPRFFNKRYAVMRHVAYLIEGGSEKPTEEGVIDCVGNAELLAKLLKGKKVILVHSPSPRAVASAIVVGAILVANGVTVVRKVEARWLGQGRPDLSEQNVGEVLGPDENLFAVLITHFEVMYYHVGFDESGGRKMANSSIYAEDFYIGTPPRP